MKRSFVLIAVLLVSVFVKAQQPSFKFDFGNGRATKGYISITTESKYYVL